MSNNEENTNEGTTNAENTNDQPSLSIVSMEEIKADLRREVKEIMMETHAELLDIANRNTRRIIQEDKRKSAPHLFETIDGELQAT